MTLDRRSKDGLRIVGLGTAACAACCAGPTLAFLGGSSLVGIASTWLIGGFGMSSLRRPPSASWSFAGASAGDSRPVAVPRNPLPVPLLAEVDR